MSDVVGFNTQVENTVCIMSTKVAYVMLRQDQHLRFPKLRMRLWVTNTNSPSQIGGEKKRVDLFEDGW